MLIPCNEVNILNTFRVMIILRLLLLLTNLHLKLLSTQVTGADKLLSTQRVKDLYFTFVYPYLIYCVEVWGNACDTHLEPISRFKRDVLEQLLSIVILRKLSHYNLKY